VASDSAGLGKSFGLGLIHTPQQHPHWSSNNNHSTKRNGGELNT
jgi:hypothetical protein